MLSPDLMYAGHGDAELDGDDLGAESGGVTLLDRARGECGDLSVEFLPLAAQFPDSSEGRCVVVHTRNVSACASTTQCAIRVNFEVRASSRAYARVRGRLVAQWRGVAAFRLRSLMASWQRGRGPAQPRAAGLDHP